MARCAVPARVVAGGTNIPATLAFEGVAPLHSARTSQRDVPTTLNTYSASRRTDGAADSTHRLVPQGDCCRRVGGTPTAAVKTTALPNCHCIDPAKPMGGVTGGGCIHRVADAFPISRPTQR